MKFQSPRGTRDILPEAQPAWQFVLDTCREVAAQLQYQTITVPTYEEVGLFQRSIGGGTDIIDKELFLVAGHKDEDGHYALRPEGTAGIVRAFVQHGMHTWPQPVKLATVVNNFRYERPQKGRYREHVQFDVEYFGDLTPFADAYVILTFWQIIRKLGIPGVSLSLNSLGTSEERASYIEALRGHLESRRDQLSEDSQRRLESNPLRILDSKVGSDQALLNDAPQLADFLGEESRAHIEAVKTYLEAWNIPYAMNPRLVRGLDYYCHTCFEWVYAGPDGVAPSLGGGGRYDKLISQLDGPETGAVGAGLGLDRIVEIITDLGLALPAPKPSAYLVLAEPELREQGTVLLQTLVEAGIPITADFSKISFGSQMKAAGRSAKLAVILGGQEAADHTLTVKNLEDGSQETVPAGEIVEVLRKQL